jgi:hypothetical protein
VCADASLFFRGSMMAVDVDEHTEPWYGEHLMALLAKPTVAPVMAPPQRPKQKQTAEQKSWYQFRCSPAVQAYEAKHGAITNLEIARFLADTKCKPVRCIETGKCYRSVAAAAQAVGSITHSLHKVLRGEYSQTGGLRWEYCSVEDVIAQMQEAGKA